MKSTLLFSLFVVLQCGLHAQVRSLDDYRKFALTHDGDVAKGRKLFSEDARLLCAKCHSLDGSASKAGPDLFAAGDAFGRRDLVDAILQPSATIAPGYGMVTVETKTGAAFQGVLKQATDPGIQIMGVDGKLVSIATADIKEKTGSALSLMPEGQHAALSREEFTDLVEFLASLKQQESTVFSNLAVPRDIPPITKPVTLLPFFNAEFKLPRGAQESGLTSMRQVPGHRNTFLVLHQKGTIWRMEKTAAGEEQSVFADLGLEVFSDRGPNGLLDMAFHPKFRDNRKYYLFFQVLEEGVVTTHIVEKEFAADFKSDSGKPARLIVKIASVAEDHSGGCLAFGPDGFLYFTMGDTGPHNDPNGHAQNLALPLGKIMRIDVDHADAGRAYSIPKDNPFTATTDARPEIWAYGLRNPWRFCFDAVNGDLWLADVGQDRGEEVDIIRRGENYGWNVYEAFEPFSNQFKKEGRAFTKPFFAYRRKYGNSITGGHVFRGDKTSSFYGVYICGDFNSKRIFGIAQRDGALKTARQIATVPQRLVSFSEDEAGNIYVVGYEGTIYQLDFNPADFASIQRVEQSGFGKTKEGAEVKLITLRNANGMSAEIISYGAIIKELRAPDRSGEFANVVLTTDTLEKYQRFNGAAAVIGRVINRIEGAQFELDGATYSLAANDGKNTIHGGRKGFAQSVWTVEPTEANNHESAVKLSYLSKDGEEGFPGNMKTSVTYNLTDANELRLDYEAATDKPTIANLTNHAYFNLAGNGGSCVDNILYIPAERYTAARADSMPTGEILPLKGTLMDFNEPTRIGDRIEQLKPAMVGYDHNYILASAPGLKLAARLTEPKSGRIMEVRTTQPAIQLYTGNHLGHTAVCLETQHYPDAIHHPNFPSIVLRPGEPLRETTVFTFTTK